MCALENFILERDGSIEPGSGNAHPTSYSELNIVYTVCLYNY